MAIKVKVNYGITEDDGNGGEILTGHTMSFTTQQYSDSSGGAPSVQPAPDSIDNDETHKQVRSQVLSQLTAGQSIRYIAYVFDKSK